MAMAEENDGSKMATVQNTDNQSIEERVSIDDKSGRIKGMGVFQIVLGSLAGLMTLILGLITVLQRSTLSSMGQTQSAPIGSLILSIGIYALLSASFIWVGIGALRLRRWVPKVVLAINWPILVMGAAVIVPLIWVIQQTMLATPMSTGPLAGIINATIAIVVVILLIIYIIIPGIHVLLFRGRKVQATCDSHDPSPRWTDDLPTSLVGLTIWLGISSFTWLGMGVAGFGTMFGFVFTGIPALLLGAVAAIAAGLLARFVAARRMEAWWGTVVFFIVMIGGSFSTFLMMDLGEFYRLSGMIPESQLTAMAPMLPPLTLFIRILVGGSGAAVLIFMAAIKGHFKTSAQ
jgi:hypothetical protein